MNTLHGDLSSIIRCKEMQLMIHQYAAQSYAGNRSYFYFTRAALFERQVTNFRADKRGRQIINICTGLTAGREQCVAGNDIP